MIDITAVRRRAETQLANENGVRIGRDRTASEADVAAFDIVDLLDLIASLTAERDAMRSKIERLDNCIICIDCGRCAADEDGCCVTCGRDCLGFVDGKLVKTGFVEHIESLERAAGERDAMRAVVEAAKAMRHVHEGCVTDPVCGDCVRCDFDAAVDAFAAKES